MSATDPDACAQPTATLAIAVAVGCLVGLTQFIPLAIHAARYIRNHSLKTG